MSNTISNLDLFNSILNDDSDNDRMENLCLISNSHLGDNHIVLNCNHKFNYIEKPFSFKYKIQNILYKILSKNIYNKVLYIYKKTLL